MRRLPMLAVILSACSHAPRHISVDNAVLGRVVIYRNGVAYYERTAKVIDGRVSVKVPRDRVDDFLKSLTVADPHTKKPLAVSIPRREADDGSYLTMTLESPVRYTEVLLTYVTESPAWKPSYRVVVDKGPNVLLEAWAIVDNVSDEDWKGVAVGVGASSALSFRYDLWSVRRIDRDLLQGEQRFAVAPPTGVSPYAETTGAEELVTLDANELRSGGAGIGSVAGGNGSGDQVGVSFSGATSLENQHIVHGINTTGMTNSPDAPSSSSALPPAISSGVRGVVTDKKTGEKLAGVTVVATRKGSKEANTAISDENGFYTMTLPVGSYTLSYFYGDTTIERSGINVAHNQVTPVYQKMTGDFGGGETIAITDKAPMIEQSSTAQGVTITRDYRNIPTGRTFGGVLGAAAGSQNDGGRSAPPPPPPPIKQGDAKLAGIVKKVLASKKDVVIEAHGLSSAEVAKRAESAKNKLVDDGIPASRIHIVPKVGPNESISLRVLAVAPANKPEGSAPPPSASASALMPDTPVGESHFENKRPMNVPAGTSAMVAMMHGETAGGVVYLYDPISDRGDERFAFKAVRLDNPSDNTLEPGPVTVFGDGRFIGEGITEPVPPKASVVVPFALDRQILVSRNNTESDRIAKLVTVQRGIITAEVQHRRSTRFTITSRLARPTKVYLRHRLETGWTLIESPSSHMKVGDSQLFEVDLEAGKTKYVTIAEATPLQRTLSLDSNEALDMMKVFIEEPDASPELKKQITALLETHRAAADLIDKIETLRDQLAEYRSRAGELHAQVVTLKLVKTSGELMTSLKSRLAETSERMQKTTIAIVDTQEKLMLARLKFGNQLADLRLTDAIAKN
ncbi:MAG TPA: carboxypeptidase regulatory-like domain-containing protein [Kofleriaceae bacterium]